MREPRIAHEISPKREPAAPEVAAMHIAKLAEMLGGEESPNEDEAAA
jgi:hypothetical protein